MIRRIVVLFRNLSNFQMRYISIQVVLQLHFGIHQRLWECFWMLLQPQIERLWMLKIWEGSKASTYIAHGSLVLFPAYVYGFSVAVLPTIECGNFLFFMIFGNFGLPVWLEIVKEFDNFTRICRYASGNTVCMGSMYILVLCRMFLRGAIKLPRSVRLLDWFLFDYFDIGVREQDCIYSTLYLWLLLWK